MGARHLANRRRSVRAALSAFPLVVWLAACQPASTPSAQTAPAATALPESQAKREAVSSKATWADFKIFAEQHKDFAAEVWPIDDQPSSRSSWSDMSEFTHGFLAFANADGTGSEFAFWRVSEDLNDCPVVVFGSEGEIALVARNFEDWLRVVSYGEELLLGNDPDRASMVAPEEKNHPAQQAAFVSWLRERGIAPATDTDTVNALIGTAEAQWQTRLQSFLARFLTRQT